MNYRQELLKAEHAAIYQFSTLGSQLPVTAKDLKTQLYQDWLTHRQLRDDLIQQLTELNEIPIKTEFSYQLNPGSPTASALELLHNLTGSYLAALPAAEPKDRAWLLAKLNQLAARQLAYQGTPEPLPGLQ